MGKKQFLTSGKQKAAFARIQSALKGPKPPSTQENFLETDGKEVHAAHFYLASLANTKKLLNQKKIPNKIQQ